MVKFEEFFNKFLDFFCKTGDFYNTIFHEHLCPNENFFFSFLIKKMFKSLSRKENVIEIYPDSVGSIKAVSECITKFSLEYISSNSNYVNIKFVLIYDIESFDKYDQINIKILMEKYSKFLRFFFFCKNVFNISETILNRSTYIQLASKNSDFFPLQKVFSNLEISFMFRNIYANTRRELNSIIFPRFYFFLCYYTKSSSKRFVSENKLLTNEYFILVLEFFIFAKKRNNIRINDEKFLNICSRIKFNCLIDFFLVLN
nr:hypothetical protein 1634Bnrm1_p074 [Cryptomonas sp.]